MGLQSNELKFFVLKRRLPASESAHLLGRVVQQYQDPTLHYTPDSPSESVTADVFKSFLLGVQYDTNAVLKVQASRNDGLQAKLSGLLSLSTGSVEGGSTTVESPCIITRRLKLEKDYFDTLKAVPRVRRKILEMCPVGAKVYLIVGTMSAQTAKFEHTATQTKDNSVSGSLQLPLKVALSMSGISHLDTLTSPEATTKDSDSSGWAMKFSSTAIREDGSSGDAEEVFAVACREISRSWSSLGQDVKMKVMYPEYRGGQHFGGEEDSESTDEEDADETMEALAAEGLSLLESEQPRSLDGLWVYST